MGKINQYIAKADIERVFGAWKKHKQRPGLCRLRRDREDLIRYRLCDGYSPDELIKVIDYIHVADEPDPKWMRGGNPRRRVYLSLENILRRERLADRVEQSTVWAETWDGTVSPYGDSNPWEIR